MSCVGFSSYFDVWEIFTIIFIDTVLWCIWQDLLISIKMLVLQRAKAIGHENLAEKFDLRTLRAIGMLHLFQFYYLQLCLLSIKSLS